MKLYIITATATIDGIHETIVYKVAHRTIEDAKNALNSATFTHWVSEAKSRIGDANDIIVDSGNYYFRIYNKCVTNKFHVVCSISEIELSDEDNN